MPNKYIIDITVPEHIPQSIVDHIDRIGHKKLIGIVMPDVIHANTDAAYAFADANDLDTFYIPISTLVADTMIQLKSGDIELNRTAIENLPARIRAAILDVIADAKNGEAIHIPIKEDSSYDLP